MRYAVRDRKAQAVGQRGNQVGTVLVVTRAVGLASACLFIGSVIVKLLAGSTHDPIVQTWRCRLVRVIRAFAVAFVASASAALAIGGWPGLMGPATSGPLASALVLHGAAAGLWLGLLPPLGLLLYTASSGSSEHARTFAFRASRRISALALAFLLISAGGVVQAWTLVGGVPRLVGTRDGHLLLLNSALLVPAVGLTVAGIARALPRLDGTEAKAALLRLTRLLTMESALGLAIACGAAVLVGRADVAHESPVWPFGFRLAPRVMWAFPGVRDQVVLGTAIVIGGLLALITAYRAKTWRPVLLVAGSVLLAVGLYRSLAAMTLDAYPTTYARPGVPYTAESVARGQDLFAAHCGTCHGSSGRGDGPAAALLLQRPADLTASHTADHTAGDLFWWITHGLGIVMPAFEDQLSAESRWHLVNFVRTLTAAEEARSLTDVPETRGRRIAAPDFTFREDGVARRLSDLRGRPVLLVLFSAAWSRARLAQLAVAHKELATAHTRVVAVPLEGSPEPASSGPAPSLSPPNVNQGARVIATTYRLFASLPTEAGGSPAQLPLRHAEFLIDRSGYLRARWIPGVPARGWDELDELMSAIRALDRESRVAAPGQSVR
jgi:putative copper resistance protein D